MFRTVTVHEHEALLQRAREFQQTTVFRYRYRKRVVAEHRIARLIHLGLRNARYFGSAKVLFQLAMTAAVANLTLTAGLSLLFVLLVSLVALTLLTLFARHRRSNVRAVQAINQHLIVANDIIPSRMGGLQLSF